MKKYVNGKVVEMTEADIAKREARANRRPNARKNATDYEARVRELETIVAELLSKQNTTEDQEA